MRFWAAHALLPGGPATDVTFTIAPDSASTLLISDRAFPIKIDGFPTASIPYSLLGTTRPSHSGRRVTRWTSGTVRLCGSSAWS